MTKNDILDALSTALTETAPTIDSDEALDPTSLTAVTDACAGVLDTVNPNGPCYPSTPR